MRDRDDITFTENRVKIIEGSNTRRGHLKIIAYEFYFRDAPKGYEFSGILPEKRRDPRRITKGSIKKLGKKITGRATDSRELLFTQVTIDRDTGHIIHPINPS
jgi:hypothetical protein